MCICGVIQLESKIFPTFQEIRQLTTDLHRKLQYVDYDYIIAPSRGGLVPGVILSHLSGKRLIPIVWSTRDHVNDDLNRDKSNFIYRIAYDIYNGSKVVLIDDINDTGETFKQLIPILQIRLQINPSDEGKLILTSLYQRYSTKHKSDYHAVTIHSDAWIVFPWEIE